LQIIYQDTIRFAEARFYFRATIAGIQETLALCSLFSPGNEQLHRDTHGALNVFEYRGEDSLVVVRVRTILSVVTMAPFGQQVQGHPARFFLVEKFALDKIDTGVILE